MTEPRTVWVVNHYAGHPAERATGSRHFQLASGLPAYGWEAVIIACGRPHHADPRARVPRRRLARFGPVTFLWLSAPGYRGSGVARLVNMIVFAAKVLWPRSTSRLVRPEVVMGSSVHLLAAWAGYRLARRHRVPFVFEVRDLWPETLIQLGLIRRRSLAARAMRALETHLYDRAESVITTLPYAVDYIAGLGVDPAKVVWISNGTDTSKFPAQSQPSHHRPFTVMYLGSHGQTNGLETVLEAFALARAGVADDPDVVDQSLRLRLIGDGPRKAALRELADRLGLADAVTFEDPVPHEQVPARIAEADTLVMHVLDLPLYRYGISMNKLFDYLAAGRPVTFAGNPRNNPVRDADAGPVVAAGDPVALAGAFGRVRRASVTERERWTANGRAYVRRNFDYATLAGRLAKVLDEARGAEGRQRRPVVAHVSSAHPWTDARVHLREAASLARAGYRVHLIAVDRDATLPPTGVQVHVLPQRARAARMLLNTVAAARLALRTRAQVLHLHDPELAGWIPVLRLLGKQVIYDAHEDLPVQVLDKHYLGAVGRPLGVRLARTVVNLTRLSSHVIAATEPIASRYRTDRVSVVRNYPVPRPEDADLPALLDRPARVIYSGALSVRRGSRQMLAAMQDESFPPQWRLGFVGNVVPDQHRRELRADPAWAGVDDWGVVSADRARDLLGHGRVGLAVLQATPAYRESLPTKMFEYFGAGMPVIASDFPLWREIVETYDCGTVVDETSPAAIARAVRRYAEDDELLQRQGDNARRAARDVFSWQREEETLFAVYDKVLRR